MPKSFSVFLDANVWFSAARSKTGGSFLIMELAKYQLIKVLTNQHVLDEAERNLLLKSPASMDIYYSLLSQVKPKMVERPIPEELVQRLKKIVPSGDILVLAGAVLSGASYLVSLDRQHIVNENMRKMSWPFGILLPGEFLKIVRKQS